MVASPTTRVLRTSVILGLPLTDEKTSTIKTKQHKRAILLGVNDRLLSYLSFSPVTCAP